MRVFTCLPKSINFQGAAGRTIGLPFLWLLSLEQTKKVTRALTLESLRSEIVFVREIAIRKETVHEIQLGNISNLKI